MELLNAEEAASRLNVSAWAVRAWCRQGKMAGASKVGRDWVIPASSVAKFSKPERGRPLSKKRGRKA